MDGFIRRKIAGKKWEERLTSKPDSRLRSIRIVIARYEELTATRCGLSRRCGYEKNHSKERDHIRFEDPQRAMQNSQVFPLRAEFCSRRGEEVKEFDAF